MTAASIWQPPSLSTLPAGAGRWLISTCYIGLLCRWVYPGTITNDNRWGGLRQIVKVAESKSGFRYLIVTGDGTTEVTKELFDSKNIGDTLCRIN